MAIVNDVIALKLVKMLVTPFEKSQAYKFGIIDKNGNEVRRFRDLKTQSERDSYSKLERLVFRLKRLIYKVPGGKSSLASYLAAYWLIKESIEMDLDESESESRFSILLESSSALDEHDTFEAEYILENIANVTGAATATDDVVVKPMKNKNGLSGIIGGKDYMFRRKKFSESTSLAKDYYNKLLTAHAKRIGKNQKLKKEDVEEDSFTHEFYSSDVPIVLSKSYDGYDKAKKVISESKKNSSIGPNLIEKTSDCVAAKTARDVIRLWAS